jgi:hypothetical protein
LGEQVWTPKKKITNHASRWTVGFYVAKIGVKQEEIIKIVDYRTAYWQNW